MIEPTFHRLYLGLERTGEALLAVPRCAEEVTQPGTHSNASCFTIAKYQKDFKVVYETARRDLAQLEALGILAKGKQGRQFIYTLNPAFLTTWGQKASSS